MENLMYAYMAMGMSTVIMALSLILIPAMEGVKLTPARKGIYTVLFVSVLSVVFPLVVYAILVETEQTKKDTKNSLNNIAETTW